MSSVVPPTYMKFQPTPSSTSDHQKCVTSCPESAMPTQANIIATPAIITFSTPKRWMSEPVKNDGPNIAITCAEITLAAAAYGWPQKPMASGVEVISRFITP